MGVDQRPTPKRIGFVLGVAIVAIVSGLAAPKLYGFAESLLSSGSSIPVSDVRHTNGYAVVHGVRIPLHSAIATRTRTGNIVVRFTSFEQSCSDGLRAFLADLDFVELEVARTPQGVARLPLDQPLHGEAFRFPTLQYTWFPSRGRYDVSSFSAGALARLTHVDIRPGGKWYGRVDSLGQDSDDRDFAIHADFGASWCGP